MLGLKRHFHKFKFSEDSYNKIMSVYISEFTFVVDLAIHSPTETALQSNLITLEDVKKTNLQINK